jgi:hypothetical protein
VRASPAWRKLRQANITSSSGRCRSRSVSATRNCAARRDVETAAKPSQVQGQFRALLRCSYPEGYGCYCMTRTQRRLPASPPRQKARPARRGAKGRRRGGERASLAKLAKPPPWGGAKNRVTQLQVERNLRAKRSDPLHGANARPKAGAVPVVKVLVRKTDVVGVPTPVRRVAHRQMEPNRAERPHSIDLDLKRSGRSRYETDSIACRDE